MHGEHEARKVERPKVLGSSPYARGALVSDPAPLAGHGIIPVCTGSTQIAPDYVLVCRDHPRMHGEHDNMLIIARDNTGSSPYARGALSPSDDIAILKGIIPVCTGSTLQIDGHWGKETDHPRMHGEHSLVLAKVGLLRGSSPYARGALSFLVDVKSSTGIIPVCTGSTQWVTRRPSPMRDHPRMHGEH